VGVGAVVIQLILLVVAALVAAALIQTLLALALLGKVTLVVRGTLLLHSRAVVAEALVR